MNENESILFYAFVPVENVDLVFTAITKFNSQQETKSKIHIAAINIEKSN
jgi:hypothetical protein